MTTVFYARPYCRFIKIQSFLRKKLHGTNQAANFLGCSFCNRDNVRPPIQFRKERQCQHLKRWLFFKRRPIHFHINRPSVIRLVKQVEYFAVLNSMSQFLPQSTMPHRSNLSSAAISSCCRSSDA